MTDSTSQLKIQLSEVVKRIAEVKQQQAYQALIWASEQRPTSYSERLKLEHELAELKSERAGLEAKIILVKAEEESKPKEGFPYHERMYTHLVEVCVEAGRQDLVDLAKAKRKALLATV